MYAQDNLKNILHAKFISYGSFSGLSYEFGYERLLSDRHRISLYGQKNRSYRLSAGIGYKYKFLGYKKFELFAGFLIGNSRFDYTISGGEVFNNLTFAPIIEVRYNLSYRFQLLVQAQNDFYLNESKISRDAEIPIKIGVGFKF
jgi:hypothetical protein